MIHILVADQKRLRVFESGANAAVLNELAVFQNRAAALHERDLVSDRPGRVMNGSGRVRHAYEPKTSERHMTLERWMRGIGGPLQDLLTSHDCKAVVLVAAPRLLAALRNRLPVAIQSLIRAELRRDLAKLPANQLKKRVHDSIVEAVREVPQMRPVHRWLASKSKRPQSTASAPSLGQTRAGAA
jgi:protein required for attachment to host cells